MLPVQFAVDQAIAKHEDPDAQPLRVNQYIYTTQSQEEYDDEVRQRFSSGVINYLSVALLIGMVGIVYHLTGWMAHERERGLSTLVEAMGGRKTARMLSYILSFTAMYILGWVVMSLNMWGGIFKKTSIAIIIIWHILTGLSLASWSLFWGAFFKKAQLSGITVTVGTLVLGIIAQVAKDSGTGAQAILSFLFPPMCYVYMGVAGGRAEKAQIGLSFTKRPPGGNSKVPVIAFFIFFIIHIVVYPFLAAFVEKKLYGTESKGHRHINSSNMDVNNAVELRGFTQRYPPRLLTRIFGKARSKEPVVAVNELNLSALRGQVLCLLGANGSGKTTTLEAIAGLSAVKEGHISISTGEAVNAMGICPQKNVLWDDLTVIEHLRMWNKIKAFGATDTPEELKELIIKCDLGPKKTVRSKNLSGGQKRKLQLAAMFTGGSSICAIDEVSSGLDPLSRRKIWDIILASRGERTILMTSHYLDEADLLADHIAILSKGTLKCEGSAVQLKTQLGGGYRVHASKDSPHLEGISTKRFYDQTVYNVTDSAAATEVIESLDRAGITDYYVQGPTIEDVFLKVAEETTVTRSENVGTQEKGEKTGVTIDGSSTDGSHNEKGVDLYDAQEISFLKQTWYLIRKRITILQRNYLPTIGAIIIPVVAAGISMVVFKDFTGVSCGNDASTFSAGDIERFFAANFKFEALLGPRNALNIGTFANLSSLLIPSSVMEGENGGDALESLTKSLKFVDTLPEFNQYIKNNFRNVTPGGLFLEGPNEATFAFQGNDGVSIRAPLGLQNLVDNLLLADSIPDGIASQFKAFDYQWPKGQGKLLVFVAYTGLAFACFPAFFALYPTYERLRHVRALHYSNGVRALPLWLAYLTFDFMAALVVCIISIIIFAAATSGWYGNLGYVFVILIFYSTASILQSYLISLITRSQLSAFAFAAGGQAVMFLVYLIIYMSILTYAEAADTDRFLDYAHYVVAAVSPIASLIKTFFVALNSFQVSCKGNVLDPTPGKFRLFGGPIFYLIVQTVLMFAFLVLYDSGHLSLPTPVRRFFSWNPFSRKKKIPTCEDDDGEGIIPASTAAIAAEAARVTDSNHPDTGLRVIHVTKNFKDFQAVDNITFGVPRDEIFALLGPNGAGKTTTINMIRGDLDPTSGNITVESVDVTKRRAQARKHLGVCPQFDAIDRMSVREHLTFYARVRGVKDPKHNVNTVITAVGLDEFQHRAAGNLSGGNKRKLSLAIALMGNPAVLLLDEPSSGMDAASKRVMWRTLESVSPNRSVVLTTHSMEECSALATRAGILAKRLLALGTTEGLRKEFGDRYLVHLVLASAPFSTQQEMDSINSWVLSTFPGAEVEARSFGGQIRFSIPAGTEVTPEDSGTSTPLGEEEIVRKRTGVAKVFRKLELEARDNGAAFWSVDRGTMEQVFLEVVGARAGVREEGYEEDKPYPLWKKVVFGVLAPWTLLLHRD